MSGDEDVSQQDEDLSFEIEGFLVIADEVKCQIDIDGYIIGQMHQFTVNWGFDASVLSEGEWRVEGIKPGQFLTVTSIQWREEFGSICAICLPRSREGTEEALLKEKRPKQVYIEVREFAGLYLGGVLND